MKSIQCLVLLSFLMMFFYGTGFAADSDNDGCMKISLSSLPIFGDSGKGDEERPRNVDDEQEYTYNAMGQKVPAGTDRSGSALSGK